MRRRTPAPLPIGTVSCPHRQRVQNPPAFARFSVFPIPVLSWGQTAPQPRSNPLQVDISLRPVADLAPYSRNARKHNASAINRLLAIIEEMG